MSEIPGRTPFPAVISARRTETATRTDDPRREGHHRTRTTSADNLPDLSGASRPARYSHITAEMRWRLLEGFTDLWNAALDQRMNYSVGSPVGVLDALLRQRRLWGEF